MVGRIRLEDLPPALRRQIAAADQRGETRSRARTDSTQPPRARPARLGPGARVRCCTCGQVFDHYGVDVERHADGHGGARIALVLETDPAT